jgi:hypothetical protein
MPRRSRSRLRFRPSTIEEVFALYLARELCDVERVRWYARLCNRYAICLLLNALRSARRRAAGAPLTPVHFIVALEHMLEGPVR